jgi:hypothetical protein
MKAGEIEVVKAMLDHDEIDCDVKFKIHGQYESAIEIAVKCQQIKAGMYSSKKHIFEWS